MMTDAIAYKNRTMGVKVISSMKEFREAVSRLRPTMFCLSCEGAMRRSTPRLAQSLISVSNQVARAVS